MQSQPLVRSHDDLRHRHSLLVGTLKSSFTPSTLVLLQQSLGAHGIIIGKHAIANTFGSEFGRARIFQRHSTQSPATWSSIDEVISAQDAIYGTSSRPLLTVLEDVSDHFRMILAVVVVNARSRFEISLSKPVLSSNLIVCHPLDELHLLTPPRLVLHDLPWLVGLEYEMIGDISSEKSGLRRPRISVESYLDHVAWFFALKKDRDVLHDSRDRGSRC